MHRQKPRSVYVCGGTGLLPEVLSTIQNTWYKYFTGLFSSQIERHLTLPAVDRLGFVRRLSPCLNSTVYGQCPSKHLTMIITKKYLEILPTLCGTWNYLFILVHFVYPITAISVMSRKNVSYRRCKIKHRPLTVCLVHQEKVTRSY